MIVDSSFAKKQERGTPMFSKYGKKTTALNKIFSTKDKTP